MRGEDRKLFNELMHTHKRTIANSDDEAWIEDVGL